MWERLELANQQKQLREMTCLSFFSFYMLSCEKKKRGIWSLHTPIIYSGFSFFIPFLPLFPSQQSIRQVAWGSSARVFFLPSLPPDFPSQARVGQTSFLYTPSTHSFGLDHPPSGLLVLWRDTRTLLSNTLRFILHVVSYCNSSAEREERNISRVQQNLTT